MSQQDPIDDAFGFRSVRQAAKDRIKEIKPSSPPDDVFDIGNVDRVAEGVGFVSREAQAEYDHSVIRRGRPRGPEAFQALNMRAPESLATAFRRWCEENRYSYPAGLAEIMRRAGISTK